MVLAGELVSLIVSWAQEISIVLGVGAVTMTLVGHLLSLHAHKNETVFGYVRAARYIRALALAAIIISGGAAILIHAQAGTTSLLLVPAFLFKWLLIALLALFYFVELDVEGLSRDAVEGFEGANWYALFIVHTMAPAIGWMLLLEIYAAWIVVFMVVWAVFVLVMRRYSTIAPKKSTLGPNPFPPPPPAAAPMPPTKPAPAAPVAAPIPVVHKPIEIHPNHSMLPMVVELDLPAPLPRVPAPHVAPAPAPMAPAPNPAVEMPNLDEGGLAAVHVMPKRPEDIESSKRGPVVKMGDE